MAFMRGIPGDTPVPPDSLPRDGVSCLALRDHTPASSLLACASWDSTVRVWELAAAGGGFPSPSRVVAEAAGVHVSPRPVLACCFRPDDNAVLFGGLSQAVHCWQPAAGDRGATAVARHAEPVKAVKWLPHHGGLVVSGSWDATVKFTDVRAPPHQPAVVVNVGHKVLAMDASAAHGLVVVATADRAVRTYAAADLAAGQPRLLDASSGALAYLYRSVALFPDGAGYALGSIEGRTTIQYLDGRPRTRGDGKTFTFKCHRRQAGASSQDAHAVNSIAFHPKGAFVTGGGDGAFSFWDYAAKSRLKQHEGAAESVAAVALGDVRGDVLAYACSDDWAKGPPTPTAAGHAAAPQQVPGVFLHRCTDQETTFKG